MSSSEDDERRGSNQRAGPSSDSPHDDKRRSSVQDPFRRAMAKIDVEDDVCSICLDEFTQEDPDNSTCCGHKFHLQCIMQWAQRSRECPLCFKELAMEDEDLHAMLPFGEYVPPDHTTYPEIGYSGMNALEVDRMFQSLALQGYRGGRRTRSRSRARAQSAQNGLANSGSLQSHPASAAVDVPNSSSQANGRGGSQGAALDHFPSSWPPHRSTADDLDQPSKSGSHTDFKETLKSRWSSFQARLTGRPNVGK